MERHLAPATILIAILTLSLGLVVGCLAIATHQPWLGIDLESIDETITIRKADTSGPMAGLTGASLISIGTAALGQIAISPDDIVEEPDTLGNAVRLRHFFENQTRLSDILSSEQILVVVRQNGIETTLSVTPENRRPVSDLPFAFWIQVLVGCVGLLIGAWVVAIRSNDLAAWMLLLTGGGLALSAQAAAIYSTRELALGMPLFGFVSRTNSFATLMFGIGIITLFLVYPRQLVRGALLFTPAVIIGVMIVFLLGLNWPDNVPLMQLFVTCAMVALLVAIIAQVWANRSDPAARAMMGWLGLSVAVGAGGFVLTAIIPYLMGRPPLVTQGTAFLFFLIFYAGVAFGVARYRLFDLADWSWGILSYAMGVVLLLAFDAFLIFGLSLERLPALSVSLALVCLTYLPLRETLAARLRFGVVRPVEDLYRRITTITNISDPDAQYIEINQLWDDLFRPISLGPVQSDYGPTAPQLVDNGRTMLLPSVAGFPALKLDFANKGGRLFSSRDLQQAKMIGQLLDDTVMRNRAHIQGIAQERSRINRDMHDNIGILLLSALHSPDGERKNTLIRQTLSDLREIVSNPLQEPQSLIVLFADLRAEISELLDAAGLKLVWNDTGLSDVKTPPQTAITLRSLLREGISNVLRHANAGNVDITVSLQNAQVSVVIADDGCGFDPSVVDSGSGLRNLGIRLSKRQGEFRITSSTAGTALSARIALNPDVAEATS